MKQYQCPALDFTCPYWDHGRCTLPDEGCSPQDECDDAFFLDPEGDRWTD